MFEYENRYLAEGYDVIAGTDEAGRGPLAGPVACAAVILPLQFLHIDSKKNTIGIKTGPIADVNDSKKLTEKKREELYARITENSISYSVKMIDEKEIDEINILNATKKGMTASVLSLDTKPDILLIDAVKLFFEDIVTVPIIKGDALSYSIAAASILAKVERDRLMREYAETYPEYGFEKHKGYGTKAHIEAIKKYGPCPIHRVSFLGNILGKDMSCYAGRVAADKTQ